MCSAELTPRWENPFIPKLALHPDLILSGSRKQPEIIRPELLQKISLYKDLILELCSGSGGHLIELAQKNPDSLCLGVELRFKRLVRTAEKTKKIPLKNLLLLQIDAQIIPEIMPVHSCNKIYINFPDPWDGKNRWEDKYLLSKDYLGRLATLLKDGGSFKYKTDHSRRFSQVSGYIEELPQLYKITEITEDLHNSQYMAENISTEFEGLFTSRKKPVFYLNAICSASSA